MFASKIVVFLSIATWGFSNASPVDNRIVGGTDAPPGVYKYLASLRINGVHFCGGNIITPRTILSAAHCLLDYSTSDVTAVVGTNHISDGGTAYQASAFKLHPDYSWATALHDVALLIVQSDIAFTASVQPIRIGETFVGGDVDVTLAGWGRTSYPGSSPKILQHIKLRTLDLDACRSRFANMGWDTDIHDSSLCTFTKDGEGACHGDSGSGLITNNWELIAVVNWGNPCARGYPDVYNRLYSELDWINANKV